MTVPHCLSVTKYAYRQIIIPGHTARQQIKAAACISANDCRLSVKMRTKHTPLRQAVAQKGSVRSFRHIAIKSCVSAGSVFILSEITRNFMYQYVAAGACGDFFRVIDRFLLRSENFQRLFRLGCFHLPFTVLAKRNVISLTLCHHYLLFRIVCRRTVLPQTLFTFYLSSALVAIYAVRRNGRAAVLTRSAQALSALLAEIAVCRIDLAARTCY